MLPLDQIARANPQFVDALYQEYRRDPRAVDERWALVFAGFELAGADGARGGPDIADVVHSWRELGHLVADLDPLGGSPREHPLLRLPELGVQPRDLERVVDWAPFRGGGRGPLRQLLEALGETYGGTLGVEYLAVSDGDRRRWLQERLEPTRGRPALSAEERRDLLDRLIAAETFEQFLQARYPGQKRFSLEGGEALVPLLDTLVDELARLGAVEMVAGMPHRGRLNVLAHVFDKPYAAILAEFEGGLPPDDTPGDGDVKYHLGYSADRRRPGDRVIHLALSPNPSHLEAVDPVVQGLARGKQGVRQDAERRAVVPVLLHGDAAFVGQGLVYETLALSALPGFTTGGTIHVIVDNQIGFTTSPAEYLFTRYPSDPAQVLRAPVLHVNADDPEAAVQAARLAAGYRQAFAGDVFVHFVCYRRHGHNELDDPTLTQPVLYEQIRNHPSVVARYTKRLVEAGVVDEAHVARVRRERRSQLEAALTAARAGDAPPAFVPFAGAWQGLEPAGEDWSADTRVAAERVGQIGEGLARLPEGFTPHPRVRKLLDERRDHVVAGAPLDWGTAELLAYGSLLLEGTPVRVCGQDVVRGTFGHRHAAVFDAADGRPWVPLNHLAGAQGVFEVVNSPLSEAGVLGFEYGMSSADPRRLVVWEAQFGDFANGAQPIIDQFITSAESKWQRFSGLVLLLPHGYEGQGPEHSSGRLERFLQLSAERNIQVIVPSLPAQLFHALRRQIHRSFRKPLVVMSPKSLLRHAASVSTVDDLASGTFSTVLDDPRAMAAESVRRLVLCSGKIYFALEAGRQRRGRDDLALLRLEQLYPFPTDALRAALARYPAAREVCWVQEEPENQGAWWFVRPRVSPLLAPSITFCYIGRDEAASPATGRHAVHQAEEQAILAQVLEA